MPVQNATEISNSSLRGVAKEVVYYNLPAPPLNFAQYLLWAASADEERRSGVVRYMGRATLGNLPEYSLSFAENEQDVKDAKAWIGFLPDREMDIFIDISSVKPPMRRFRKSGEMVSTDYIDCACETDYIREAPAFGVIRNGYEVICPDCRIPYMECPFSLVSEVMKAGLPFDEHAVRTIEFNRETVPPPL